MVLCIEGGESHEIDTDRSARGVVARWCERSGERLQGTLCQALADQQGIYLSVDTSQNSRRTCARLYPTPVSCSPRTPGGVRPCSRSDTPHRLWPYSPPGAQRCMQSRISDLLKGQQDSRLRGRGRSGPAYCLIPSWRFCVSGLPYLPTSSSKSLWPPFTNCFRPRKTAARKWSPDLVFSRNSSGE